MPRLSRVQDETRHRIERLAGRGLLPEPLGQGLLVALQHAVPNDGQRLFGIDPRTLLINRLLAASPGDGPFRLRWLRDIYLAGDIPYFDPGPLMRAEITSVVYRERQEQSRGLPSTLLGQVSAREHTLAFHEATTPIGGSLRTCFRADRRWIAALDIVRRGANRPLAASDVSFLRLIAPTIGRALGAAFAREQALTNGHLRSPAASGVLLLAPDRRAQFVTPAGEAWLDILWDTGRDGHGSLPTAVWSAVAGLNAATGDRIASSLVIPTPVGPVRVEASPGADDGSVAVVLAPERPPEPPTIPSEWHLTRQECQVVSLLLRGLGNRQIAAKLTVSENTIEWHLRRAYEKLDVHSRSQLQARFFRDTSWSALERGGTQMTSRERDQELFES